MTGNAHEQPLSDFYEGVRAVLVDKDQVNHAQIMQQHALYGGQSVFIWLMLSPTMRRLCNSTHCMELTVFVWIFLPPQKPVFDPPTLEGVGEEAVAAFFAPLEAGHPRGELAN